MDTTTIFVIKKLLSIRKKHLNYFKQHNLKIRDCVKIVWVKPFSAHVIHTNLPFEIACDLEEMFWISDDSLVKNITFIKRLNAAKNELTELNQNIEVYRFNNERFKMNLEKFRAMHSVYWEKSLQIFAENS